MKSLISLLFLVPGLASAQVEHTETINANNVAATIGDNGQFFHPASSTLKYEVPAGSDKNTIFSASIWTAALDVNGILYYSHWQSFHSGPIADPMFYGTTDYSNQYGKSIWKVTRDEIDEHILNSQQSGYVVPSSIENWPGNGDVSMGVAQKLAPFVDINANGVYEPSLGDYPNVPGDEAVFVILNDKSYQADATALGIELHYLFYQFNDSDYLGNTTFLNVQAFNRSSTNYYDYHQTLYVDFDIGYSNDDFLGSYSPSRLFYGYNGDNFDEPNGISQGYGSKPPCQGVMVLNREISSIGKYNANEYDYSQETHLWNFMNASDSASNPWAENFYMDMNPFVTPDTTSIPASDLRGAITLEETKFLSGQMICTDYAFIFSGTDGHLKNVDNVINISNALQSLYDQSNDFPCALTTLSLPAKESISDFKMFPNPSSGGITIELEDWKESPSVKIFDVSGRVVYSGSLNASKTLIQLNETPGFYSVSVFTKHGVLRKSLVLQ